MLKCLVCGSENMKAEVKLSYSVPLAARGGGIKIGGIKVTQMDLKLKWDELTERPIICHECGQGHMFHVGADEPLQIAEDT